MEKTKKKLIFSVLFIVITICLGLILSSCFLRDDNKNSRSILDVYSRDVSYPKEVNRIATVGSATRMVVYAGAQDKLVAVTDMDKPSELRPYTLVCPEILTSLPSTNNGNQFNDISVDKEAMLEANPDVIFSTRSAEECDELQNDLKIPVIGVRGSEDITNDLSYKPLMIIGEVTGNEERAYRTVGYLRSLLNNILSIRNDNNTKLYRGAINFKGSKDLTGTYSNFCIYKILKSKNVADIDEFTGAYDTNLEQILQWDPDYIFMDCTNLDKVNGQKEANKEVFSKIRAINKGQTYLTGPYNYNGTNLEYAFCELYLTASILHPNDIPNSSLETKFAQIIEQICGKNIYPELVNRGIKLGKTKI